tara:strand:+ start:157 stop:489 length:333 start_codon:yes stop_codon:yes gene_type:complete
MSDYNWCHGPSCHERETTTRVRGVKGSKVLRTIKIACNDYRAETVWKYFCDQTCLMNFIHEHYQEFIRLHPRTECLETPIEDPVKETHETPYGYSWTNTTIKKVDNNSNP